MTYWVWKENGSIEFSNEPIRQNEEPQLEVVIKLENVSDDEGRISPPQHEKAGNNKLATSAAISKTPPTTPAIPTRNVNDHIFETTAKFEREISQKSVPTNPAQDRISTFMMLRKREDKNKEIRGGTVGAALSNNYTIGSKNTTTESTKSTADVMDVDDENDKNKVDLSSNLQKIYCLETDSEDEISDALNDDPLGINAHAAKHDNNIDVSDRVSQKKHKSKSDPSKQCTCMKPSCMECAIRASLELERSQEVEFQRQIAAATAASLGMSNGTDNSSTSNSTFNPNSGSSSSSSASGASSSSAVDPLVKKKNVKKGRAGRKAEKKNDGILKKSKSSTNDNHIRLRGLSAFNEDEFADSLLRKASEGSGEEDGNNISKAKGAFLSKRPNSKKGSDK